MEEFFDPVGHLGLEGFGCRGGLPFLLLSWCGGYGGDDGLCWLVSSFEGEGEDRGIGDELAVGEREECRLRLGGDGGVGGGEGVWLRCHGHGVVLEGVIVRSEVGGGRKAVVLAADPERSGIWVGVGVGLSVATHGWCCGGDESIGTVVGGAEVVILVEEGEMTVG